MRASIQPKEVAPCAFRRRQSQRASGRRGVGSARLVVGRLFTLGRLMRRDACESDFLVIYWELYRQLLVREGTQEEDDAMTTRHVEN